MLAPVAEIERELELLATDGYCADARAVVRSQLELLLPPEDISTKECAEKHRYLPASEGGIGADGEQAKRLYDRSLTPYMDTPQDAMDAAEFIEVDVVGPGRTGKSIAGENHLFKRLRNGPLTDTIIYLPAAEDVNSYADKEFADFFNLHPEIMEKLGKRPTDNKRKFKRVAGRAIQLFPANPGTVRQKQAPLIMATEVDGFRPKLRAAFRGLARVRGRAFGSSFKLYMESHPDAGWSAGIASFWMLSNRGLWYWPCPHCKLWSSPHPLAPKVMDPVSGVASEMYMRLEYDRDDELEDDELLDHVEATGGLGCPHCGVRVEDKHKAAMNLAGKWVFAGQAITPDGTVHGEPKQGDTAGFWIHGTMSPFLTWGRLAREYVEVLLHYERTRKPEPLAEFTAKTLGEVYQGKGPGSRVLDPKRLAARVNEVEINPAYARGTCPPDVFFLTAAVDVGGRKFDYAIWGWDLEGRSWLIERDTIRENLDGQELRPAERQKDWLVIRDQLLKRFVPLSDDDSLGMPIACVAIDTGGAGNSDGEEPGGVTWKAREFARAMAKSGDSGIKGYRLMLVKGRSSKTAPEVGAPREINKDADGRAMKPAVKEHTINVDKLKMQAIERLAVEDGGPGQVHFATGLPKSTYDELCGEVMVDGKFERRGANETLDLFGYGEAARISLQPERAEIRWLDDDRGPAKPPVWARPVPLEADGTTKKQTTKRKTTSADRLAEINRR
jgi:phage terminase large subunit GpA-like protein